MAKAINEEEFVLTTKQKAVRFSSEMLSDDVDKAFEECMLSKTKKQTDWAMAVGYLKRMLMSSS